MRVLCNKTRACRRSPSSFSVSLAPSIEKFAWCAASRRMSSGAPSLTDRHVYVWSCAFGAGAVSLCGFNNEGGSRGGWVLQSFVWRDLFAPCCCCCIASVLSDSVRPHRRQPLRLRRPWDSPDKNTGVGCHFLLKYMKVKSESDVA